MTHAPAGSATAELFARQRFGVAPGLGRTRRLLERLGRPQDAFDAVLIAGTNGKGGTVAHLDAMLRADDRPAAPRVGRTTSPHLVDPGERIVIDGQPLAAAAFDALAAEVVPVADELEATFFEVVTAMALLAFARGGVGVALVEVGMGGRLDATNVLQPRACGVAQIALDHQAVLGPDLASIAREKAGILRPGVPAWSSAQGEGAEALRRAAQNLGAPLAFLDHDADVDVRDLGWDGSEVTIRRPGADRVTFRTPLIGAAQARNAALAAAIAHELGLPDAALVRGAAATAWPGRLERLLPGPRSPAVLRSAPGALLVDGAHNPAAASALGDALERLGTRPRAVLGMAADKDVAGVLAALGPSLRSVRVTRATTSPRAESPWRLAEQARAAGLVVDGVHDDPAEAAAQALTDATDAADASDSRDVLVAGSLYLVGEVRAWALGAEMPAWERWQ